MSATRALLVVALVAGCGQARAPQASATATSPERDPKLVAFCIDNLRKEHACFDDDNFWDVFATLQLDAVRTHLPMPALTPESKKRAIGIMKDDLVHIGKTTRAYQTMCETMLRTTQTPSPRSVAAVTAARGKSCAEFANAYGSMIFVEGALRNSRAR